jgi:hypothetical protein
MDNKKNNWKNNWNKWFLKYFDFNQNKTVEWWEYLIPIILIFIINNVLIKKFCYENI